MKQLSKFYPILFIILAKLLIVGVSGSIFLYSQQNNLQITRHNNRIFAEIQQIYTTTVTSLDAQNEPEKTREKVAEANQSLQKVTNNLILNDKERSEEHFNSIQEVSSLYQKNLEKLPKRVEFLECLTNQKSKQAESINKLNGKLTELSSDKINVAENQESLESFVKDIQARIDTLGEAESCNQDEFKLSELDTRSVEITALSLNRVQTIVDVLAEQVDSDDESQIQETQNQLKEEKIAVLGGGAWLVDTINNVEQEWTSELEKIAETTKNTQDLGKDLENKYNIIPF